MLLALCRRALDDRLAAEDAAQEAALQAMLNLDHLRQPERFGAWLSGIGLNVCRRWLRRQTREYWSWETVHGGWQVPEAADRQASPEELAEAADLRARVRQAVAGLPPGQRSAVLLFYLAGLTQAETALLLGIEVGAVKTRLHKARQSLRQHLWTLWQEERMSTEQAVQFVEMRVAHVRRRPAETEDMKWRSVVVLEEVGGGRRLPIWIGAYEAEALVMHLERLQPPRPVTYTFIARLLDAAGGHLRAVRITQLREQVYYALAVVEGPTGLQEVDARPSDALNLALIAGAPIRVAASVLEAGSTPAETGPVAWPEHWYDEGSQGTAEIATTISAGWKEKPAEPV